MYLYIVPLKYAKLQTSKKHVLGNWFVRLGNADAGIEGSISAENEMTVSSSFIIIF